jgi:hypothetical protein
MELEARRNHDFYGRARILFLEWFNDMMIERIHQEKLFVEPRIPCRLEREKQEQSRLISIDADRRMIV